MGFWQLNAEKKYQVSCKDRVEYYTELQEKEGKGRNVTIKMKKKNYDSETIIMRQIE